MYNVEIQQIKDAGDQYNWDLLEKGLKSIICKVKQDKRLRLLLSYINIFMKDFLITYPQYQFKFDSQTIEQSQSVVQYLDSITEMLSHHKGEPGINNFRKAISNLKGLYELEDCDENFVDTFVNTLINFFIGIIDQNWGRTYPDLYVRWLHGTIGEDFHILSMRAKSPEYKLKQKILFYQIAEDINNALEND